MRYRTLGQTGLDVSVIGVGTWQFGGEWGKQFSQEEASAILSRAKELGVNLIDTAECYGDHLSESLIADVLSRDRKYWILATKFGHKFHGYLDRTEPRTPGDVTEQLHSSLKALRTDYVDLYSVPLVGGMSSFSMKMVCRRFCFRHKEEGKIRHMGSSVSKNDNVKNMVASAKKQIESIQIIYNRLDRTPETTTFPICQEQHLGVLARVPLASGLLSGKYKPGVAVPTRRSSGEARSGAGGCEAAGGRGDSDERSASWGGHGDVGAGLVPEESGRHRGHSRVQGSPAG